MNVTSARVDLKAACRPGRARSSSATPSRWPRSTAATWPARLLELAWRRVVDNSAHDSICGCSHDAVVAQVLTRFAEAEQIGTRRASTDADRRSRRGVPRRPVGRRQPIAGRRASTGRRSTSPSRLDCDGGRPAQPATGCIRPRSCRGRTRPSPDPRCSGRDPGAASAGAGTAASCSAARSTGRASSPARTAPRRGSPSCRRRGRPARARRRGAARAGSRRPSPRRPDERGRSRRPGGRPATAPGAGRRRPRSAGRTVGRRPRTPGQRRRADRRIRSSSTEGSMANGLVAVERRRTTARSELSGGGVDARRASAGSSTAATTATATTTARRAADTVVETPPARRDRGRSAAGPAPRAARGRAPRTTGRRASTADGSARSATTAPTDVATTLELRAGEPFVRVQRRASTTASRDHRVRWHIPLAATGRRTSAAEGQFAVVERGLTVEGGHGEVPLADVPGPRLRPRRRASASCSITSTEYEVVERTRAGADGPPLDRADQPQREPVPRGSGRAGGPGPGRAAPRPRGRSRFALLPHAGLVGRRRDASRRPSAIATHSPSSRVRAARRSHGGSPWASARR